MEKIDIVVLWVDGNDPQWLEEKQKYMNDSDNTSAFVNRYREWGLMKYWFRGVEKFAPWVNHVFFVTCGHYPEWLNLSNPKLTLIKHSDFMPNDILPTFNSNSIEMYIHRIPGLSEEFICFNDDMFFIAPTEENDFFKDGKPLESFLLGTLTSDNYYDVFSHILLNNSTILNMNFNKKAVLKNNMNKIFSLKYGKEIFRNLLLFPFLFFSDFRDLHLPTSYLKSQFERVWSKENKILSTVTKGKFRSKDDVSHWLIKDWYLCEGEFEPRSPKWGKKFELGRDNDVYNYILKQSGKVVCLNDSDDSIDFNCVQPKLVDCFETLLPDKSQFEL